MWIIQLKCFEASGYFTGIIQSSSGSEVGVHPYKAKAKKFKTKEAAESTAKYLKAHFRCVLVYRVEEI